MRFRCRPAAPGAEMFHRGQVVNRGVDGVECRGWVARGASIDDGVDNMPKGHDQVRRGGGVRWSVHESSQSPFERRMRARPTVVARVTRSHAVIHATLYRMSRLTAVSMVRAPDVSR